MIYPLWEIGKVSRGLNNYRDLITRGKKLPSWEVVAAKVRAFKKTRKAVGIPSTKEDITGESVRRLAAGKIKDLHEVKLEIFKAFLIQKGVFIEDDFLENNALLREIVVVRDHLGSVSTEAKKFLKRINLNYALVQKSPVKALVKLELELAPSKNFFYVEETVQRFADDTELQRDYTKKDGFVGRFVIRQGYAFTLVSSGILHVFLQGAIPGDRVSYVQVDAFSGEKVIDHLVMLRSGTAAIAQEDGLNQQAALSNIHAFTAHTPKGKISELPITLKSRWKQGIEELELKLSSSIKETWSSIGGTTPLDEELLKVYDVDHFNNARGSRELWEIDENGMTLLHRSVARGERPLIRRIVAHGPIMILARDNLGRYASDIAFSWTRDYAVARLLLKWQRREAKKLGLPAWLPRSKKYPPNSGLDEYTQEEFDAFKAKHGTIN